jgi:hypothetical protein
MISAPTFVLIWLIVTILTNIVQAIWKPIDVKINDVTYAVLLVCYVLFMIAAALVILL